MTQIVSPHNPRLKSLRRLHERRVRERTGRFLAEGEDLVLAAERAHRPALEGYRVAGSNLGAEGFLEVEAQALRTASSLGSGTRVIGVYEQRWGEPSGPLCVYLHGVADPGNVGSVLRSAAAFGASCVALGPGCADPHSPKAVRASMGAIFSVGLARVCEVAELPGRRVALLPDGAEPLRACLGRQATAAVTLLIGAERDGLPRAVIDACDCSARIEIAAESLNAAMAATVALYEMRRTSGGVATTSRVSA